MSRPHRTVLLGAAALALMTSAGCTSDSGPAARPAGEARPTTAVGSADDLQNAYQDTVKNVLPSVVQITTARELGSGVVYDDKGDIVTNAHVVGDSRTFRVSLATGGRLLELTIRSFNPASRQ